MSWRPGVEMGANENTIKLTALKEIWLFFLNKVFVNFQRSENVDSDYFCHIFLLIFFKEELIFGVLTLSFPLFSWICVLI